MKRIGMGALALVAVIVAVGLLRGPQPAHAQADETVGWLEGTIKDGDDTPIGDWTVRLLDKDGNVVTETLSNRTEGGLYTLRNLKPGVYEIRILSGGSADRLGELRHQRIWGVAIKKGVRSVLDIRLKEGKSRDLEEIGKPSVPTQPVMLLSDEIDRLKADVAELKRQLDELKKKNP